MTGEFKAVGRGLNWVSGPGAPTLLDLKGWQEFFGFDNNGAYADISTFISNSLRLEEAANNQSL